VVSNKDGLHDDVTLSDVAKDWRRLVDLQGVSEVTLPIAVWPVWLPQGETMLWRGLQCLGSADAVKDSKHMCFCQRACYVQGPGGRALID